MDLQFLKKGNESIQKYFHRVKTLAHQLTIAAHPVSYNDLVLYILGGLPSEYGPFRISISTRVEVVTLSDLLGYLLAEEFHIGQDASPSDISPIANLANRASTNNHGGRGLHHSRRSRTSRSCGHEHGHSQYFSCHVGLQQLHLTVLQGQGWFVKFVIE